MFFRLSFFVFNVLPNTCVVPYRSQVLSPDTMRLLLEENESLNEILSHPTLEPHGEQIRTVLNR